MLENRYAWYSKLCVKFVNRCQMDIQGIVKIVGAHKVNRYLKIISKKVKVIKCSATSVKKQ